MDLDRSQLAYIKAGNERIPTGLQLDGMELDGSQPAILDKPKMDGIQLAYIEQAEAVRISAIL